MNGLEGLLGMEKVLSLEDEDGFSVATAFAPSFLPPPCPLSASISTFTILLWAPTALLAMHS